MKFGHLLRKIREQKKMPRSALVKASGVPFGTIQGYETIRRAPFFGSVVKLAKALGVSVEVFAECEDMVGEFVPDPPKKAKVGRPRKNPPK